jgi:predicted nucleic acid-binding protein
VVRQLNASDSIFISRTVQPGQVIEDVLRIVIPLATAK